MARTIRKRWRPRFEVAEYHPSHCDTNIQMLVRYRGEKPKCVCCSNPRRRKGSSKDRLTIQERRHEWYEEKAMAETQPC